MKKAYWNMQMIENDGSYGVHNSKFAVAVLQKSIKALAPNAIKDAKFAASTYKLEQNYPNPFNPTTKISFTVPTSGNVKIRIFDVMGNLVKEVYNQNVVPGQYSAVWSGDDARGNKVASGIYFYKLEAQNFTVSKKMILMK
jgi:flagellar hook assembly protein FlgD